MLILLVFRLGYGRCVLLRCFFPNNPATMNYDDDEHDDDDCFADTQEVSFSVVSEKQHMMRIF